MKGDFRRTLTKKLSYTVDTDPKLNYLLLNLPKRIIWQNSIFKNFFKVSELFCAKGILDNLRNYGGVC